MNVTNGLHLGLSREEYDAIDRMHHSILKHMRRSPAHLMAASLGKHEDEDSEKDALVVGRAFHTATLEPELFDGEWAVWKGGTRRGKEWDAFRAAHPNILTENQFEMVRGMSASVRSHAAASRYLVGNRESSILWTDRGTGVDCKGRLDGENAEGGFLMDLKSTRDASPEAFSRTAYYDGLLEQAAMYTDGYFEATRRLFPFVIVAVEKVAPYAVAVYRLPGELIEVGREIYRGHLVRLAECRKAKRWPGYGDTETDLALPRWVANEIQFKEAA